MTNEHVTEQVMEALTERCGLARENIEPSSRLVEDLELDSIDSVEISIALEKTFDIEFGQDGLKGVGTVSGLVSTILNLLAKKSHSQ